MTLDNITGITKGSWTVDSLFCKSQLITCNRVNECNGVCPFEDALKHADKEQSLNEQNNEHDREWIIGCIEHDGFIKTDRFDKANQIILDALQTSVVRCKDCKHWEKTNIETIDGHPTYDCPFCGEWADANGFCSFGERREDGTISNT